MEHYKEPLPPLIEVGVIDTERVVIGLDTTLAEIERDMQKDYRARPVPQIEINRRLRLAVEAEMFDFPFFKHAELVARVLSVNTAKSGAIDIDDPALVSPQGVDFKFGAAFAISSVNQDLMRKGFEYDPDKHNLNSEPIDGINQEVDDALKALPEDITLPSWSKGRRLDIADAAALSDLILGEAKLRYEMHRAHWWPILDRHVELFMPDKREVAHYSLYGIGFGLALMDGLKTDIEDAYVNSFRMRIAELDEKGIEAVFDY